MREAAPKIALTTALALGCSVLGCGDAGESPISAGPAPGITIDVTARLEPADREPFKVDARLEARYELAPPFSGESPVGVLILPAGRREATTSLRVSPQQGRLLLEEVAFPSVPFLCGASKVFDPRAEGAVTIEVRLCFP